MVLSDFDISPTEAMFLALVASLSKNDGTCYASKEYIAETMNISKPTVFKMIKKLQRMGLLEKWGYSKYKTSRIILTETYKESMEEAKRQIQEMKNEH
jgi:Mn-dependent DtxR family transcriptional regulator